jgi:hypothetical protein
MSLNKSKLGETGEKAREGDAGQVRKVGKGKGKGHWHFWICKHRKKTLTTWEK